MQPAGTVSNRPGSVSELERLFEITRDVLEAPTLDAALNSLARGVQELFGWRFVTMVAAEEPNGDLRRRIMLGFPEEIVNERLYENVDREAFAAMLEHAVRFFDDCYFFPAERDAEWERSIYTGFNPNQGKRSYPNQWQERDALVLTLHDRDGIMVGYMSPDGPLNGEIPTVQTLRAMQVFVNLMGLALVNARSQSRLQYEATHDSLTALPNRTVFSLQLARSLEAVHRGEGEAHTVLYLDLDEFKSINDTLGHLAGDDVLKETSQRLRMVVDERSMVARMAGDEFAILIPGTSTQAIRSVLDTIHETLRRPFEIAGRTLTMAASIGIVSADQGYTSIAEVLRDAETAMYRAKHQGRDRDAVFTPTMHEEALQRLSLRLDLRAAIEQRQLVVMYQPIVTLADGSIEAVEALLRWNHPEQGYLVPAAFLPLAEEMGLMEPVGRFVLDTACHDLARWQKSGHPNLGLNVNVSVQEVLQPNLPEFLKQLVRTYRIDPKMLSLEITETSILQSEHRAEGILERLKAIGLNLCLDDFGTGYSSLQYITSLPIDAFKIDQSFIAALQEPKGEQIVRLLVQLGEACALRVTAEGIENAAQAKALLEIGCSSGQGVYFHSPLPAKEVSELLR
ncbi:MAG TPA: EAL domain-containing protein [Candidatus Rubrimentiphilum sp.]|nr:EAL domain-containing protein [Candidatus Rubrimentiphilum sp.]